MMKNKFAIKQEIKKSNDKVCVIYGGLSPEREISLKSGKNIYDALKKSYKTVELLDAKNDVSAKVAKIKPDICVIALHGNFGEDGSIQGVLEWLEIPYTGSGVSASAIAFDKVLAKQTLIGAGVATPKFMLANKSDKKAPFLPCVVKPARQGSSIGVSIVKKEADFAKAIVEAFKFDDKVIVEEFIAGKELTIPVMDGKPFPPIWIKPKQGFYDYKNKYTAGMTEYLLDTQLSQSRLKKLEEIAINAYRAFGCRGMARIDFIATDKKFYAIEVNTLPGMTATSLVPKSASKVGVDFDELCRLIATSASLDNKSLHTFINRDK